VLPTDFIDEGGMRMYH